MPAQNTAPSPLWGTRNHGWTHGDVTPQHPQDIAGHQHHSCPVISTCPVIPPGTARSANPLAGKCASQNSGRSYHGNKERFLGPSPPKYLFASQGFTGYLTTTTTTTAAAAKPERHWSRTKSRVWEGLPGIIGCAGGVTAEQDEPVNRPRISAYALHTNMPVHTLLCCSKA